LPPKQILTYQCSGW